MILNNVITFILGIIMGFIYGYMLFRKVIYVGPNSNDIINTVFKDNDNRKYRYVTQIRICPITEFIR